MFWRSSGIRITTAVLASFVFVAIIVVGAIYWQTTNIVAHRQVATVIEETRALSEIAARDGLAELLRTLRERSRDRNAMLYGLADGSGRVIWLGGLQQWPTELARDNATGVFEFTQAPMQAQPASAPIATGPIAQSPTAPIPGASTAPKTTTDSPRALALGATLRLPDGERLLVARNVSEQRDIANIVRNWFLAGLALLSILAVATGWIINRLLLQRIDALTETTSGIMAGDFSKRVALTDRHDEFDALAENLNAMLDRIESLMHGLREVSDNIAHDLKTPLNRLRIRAEEALRDPRGDVACRAGLQSTLTEADELIRTFNALLRVARLEAGTLGTNQEVFDLTALILDLAEFYEPVVEEAGATLRVQPCSALRLYADRQLISQALTNLLENAIKYGAPSASSTSPFEIVIAVQETAAGVEISVSDRGLGIARQDYDRVLRRFVRLDAARTKPGTGLGLSLVAAVVRQHGGTIELADNAPGLQVILTLPIERLVRTVLPSGRASDLTPSLEPTRTQVTLGEA